MIVVVVVVVVVSGGGLCFVLFVLSCACRSPPGVGEK